MVDIFDSKRFVVIMPIEKGWSEDVLRWYGNMQNSVPTWYLKGYVVNEYEQ